MKTISIQLLALLVVFASSCGSDDIIPFESNCNLTSYSSNRVSPSATMETNMYTHYEDSIVNIKDYVTDGSREVYKFNEGNNTIESVSRKTSDGSIWWYATYYLNGQGLIDSVVRRNGTTDEINYRFRVTRNSSNQVITEYIDYIN